MSDMLHVAVAVIRDKNGCVLITKRALHTFQGGLWEFPGGKLEPGETAADALVREIKEELGLTIQTFEHLSQLVHVYPTRTVTLWVYQVTDFTGTPHCREGQQDMRWVAIADLSHYPLLEGSQRLIPLIHPANF